MNKKFLIPIFALTTAALIVWYAFLIYESSNGKLTKTLHSDDDLYTAEIYTIRQPTQFTDFLFEVKILDSKGDLVKKSFVSAPMLSVEAWDCPEKKCVGFLWGPGDNQYVTVPPSFLDRVIAKMP